MSSFPGVPQHQIRVLINNPMVTFNPGTILAPIGTITAVIAAGSTTGTWAHYLRYKPLATGVTVS